MIEESIRKYFRESAIFETVSELLLHSDMTIAMLSLTFFELLMDGNLIGNLSEEVPSFETLFYSQNDQISDISRKLAMKNESR